MGLSALRPACLVLAGLTMLAGGLGMALSFYQMAEGSPLSVTAGSAGFVAGAVLVGAGLISLSWLVTTSPKRP